MAVVLAAVAEAATALAVVVVAAVQAVAAVVAVLVAAAVTAAKPQRSSINTAVLLREQQGVNWSFASCSSPLKYISR